MKLKNLIAFAAALAVCPAVCSAGPIPAFGAASAYNLVALGYGNIAGNISDGADITGRIAAANQVTVATTIGSSLASNDPFGSSTSYAIVAGNGVAAGSNYFNINGGGNVFSTTTGNFNWNENPKGILVSGTSPIDFIGLRTSLDALSLQVATLLGTGQVDAPTPAGGNPSWFVLAGTSSTLNIFNITAAEFASVNNPIDIEVPVGSTVIINVSGTNVSLGAGIYLNGKQESDSNNDGGDILFNFAGASSVYIGGQLDGSVLAPFAVLTGGSQMGGTFIAAQIGQTGEVHNLEYQGVTPFSTPTDPIPEPSTLIFMGTGMLSMATLLRRRMK
jgi:choice-of-anchor A domain-containing protein